MIVDKINKLAKSKNTSIAAIEREAGLKRGTIGKWDTSTPAADKLFKVANLLQVPMECFFTDGKYTTVDKYLNTNNINFKFIVTEKNINDNFNLLKLEHKERILGRIEAYLEEYEIDIENKPEIKIIDLYGNNKTYEYRQPDSNASYVAESKIKNEVVIKHLPILGQTAAGQPIDIIEVGGGNYIEVPNTIDADYALFVKGDSMEPVISDKDLVYIKSMPEVENGTIGVVDIDGTVTCKKIHRYNGKVELKSLNPDHKPIILNVSDHIAFRIIGKVVFCRKPNSKFFAI